MGQSTVHNSFSAEAVLEFSLIESLESRRLLSVVSGDGTDGSAPCPESTDNNGDPLYCIMESGVATPAPAPTVADGTLTVTGTAGDDNIRISIGKDTTKLAVKVNGAVTLFSLASVTKIKVDGLAGNDVICIKQNHGAISIATELNGGDGNDQIRGGDGNDI